MNNRLVSTLLENGEDSETILFQMPTNFSVVFKKLEKSWKSWKIKKILEQKFENDEKLFENSIAMKDKVTEDSRILEEKIENDG